MNNEPTYEGFIKFINEQPVDREIDHAGTWADCAVGDYLEDSGMEDVYEMEQWAWDVLYVQDRGLFDDLAFSAGDNFPTYGDLQKRST